MFSDNTCRERLSNAVRENFFGSLKKYTIGGERHIKCSRFIRHHINEISSIYKEVCLNVEKINLTQRNRSKNICNDNTSDEKLSQESWNKI